MLTRVIRNLTGSRAFAVLCIALLGWGMALGLRQAGLLQGLELGAYDQFLRLRAKRVLPDSPVVIVGVTEEDIQRYGYPLSDLVVAQTLKVLLARKPDVIGIDIFRDLPSAGREGLQSVATANRNLVFIEKRLGQRLAAPGFVDPGRQVGFADIVEDPGGVIRRGLLMVWDEQDQQRSYLSFAAQLALAHLEKRGVTLRPDPANSLFVAIGQTGLPRFRGNDGGYVNADPGGYQFLLDYRQGRGAFRSFSLSQTLNGELRPSDIEGRIVILCMMAMSLGDAHETPFSAGWGGGMPMHGAVIHGHAVDQLVRLGLNGDAPIRTMSEVLEGFYLLIFSLLGAIVALTIVRPAGLTLAGLSVLTAPMALGATAFLHAWWLPATAPVAAALASLTIGVAKERSFIQRLFVKYVPKPIADWILDEGGEPPSREGIATILFVDLKGCCGFAEGRDPAEVRNWLNTYLGPITRLVESHGGIVEDYAGDGVKASFGVPVSHGSVAADAVSAVECALAMGAEIARVSEDNARRGCPRTRARIGIYTGLVDVGVVGGSGRQAIKTSGDTVNIAARLESLDKDVFAADPLMRPCRIFIGDTTFQHLGTAYRLCPLGERLLAGRSERVAVYQVLGRIDNTSSETTTYLKEVIHR
jgi:adenylate cyclase